MSFEAPVVASGNSGRRAENRMSVGDGFRTEHTDSTEVSGHFNTAILPDLEEDFCSSRLLSSQFSLYPTTSFTTIVGCSQFMATRKPRN
jgi:hypothetical protein